MGFSRDDTRTHKPTLRCLPLTLREEILHGLRAGALEGYLGEEKTLEKNQAPVLLAWRTLQIGATAVKLVLQGRRPQTRTTYHYRQSKHDMTKAHPSDWENKNSQSVNIWHTKQCSYTLQLDSHHFNWCLGIKAKLPIDLGYGYSTDEGIGEHLPTCLGEDWN